MSVVLLAFGCGAKSTYLCDPSTEECDDPCRGASVNWTVEVVDEGGDHNDEFNLLVDETDTVHLAYEGRDHNVFHAVSQGEGWSVETIATGTLASLAIGPRSVPQAVYMRREDGKPAGDVMYARRDGGRWVAERIDRSFDFATALAIDSEGFAYVLYPRWDEGTRLATNASGKWVSEPLAADGVHHAVAMDANDTLHVVYVAKVHGDEGITHAARSPDGEWFTETAVPHVRTVYRIAFALDPEGFAHVAYEDVDDDALFYATNRVGSWNVERVTAMRDVREPFDSLALAVEPGGTVRFLYHDHDSTELLLATRREGRWSVEVVDRHDDRVITGLAFSDSRIHVAYAGWVEGQVRYASRRVDCSTH